MQNPSTCDCNITRHVKLTNIWEIKTCSCKNRLIGKLVLEYEDEILNTTENSLANKKVLCKKVMALITIYHQ